MLMSVQSDMIMIMTFVQLQIDLQTDVTNSVLALYDDKSIERCSYNCFLGCNENAQNIIFNARFEREIDSEGVDQASLLTWSHLHPI